MANGFVYELAMALVPGALAGYYSGLLMAKQAKFNSLKHESLRCIRLIDYMGDDAPAHCVHVERVHNLQRRGWLCPENRRDLQPGLHRDRFRVHRGMQPFDRIARTER